MKAPDDDKPAPPAGPRAADRARMKPREPVEGAVFLAMGLAAMLATMIALQSQPADDIRRPIHYTTPTVQEQEAWKYGQNLYWCRERMVRKVCQQTRDTCTEARGSKECRDAAALCDLQHYETWYSGKGSTWAELKGMQSDRLAQAWRAHELLGACLTDLGEDDAEALKLLNVSSAPKAGQR